METNEQKIINFLCQGANKDYGYCDDCLSNKLHIKPRQQINQICRNLENKKKISRVKSTCYICKYLKISNFIHQSINENAEANHEKNNASSVINNVIAPGANALGDKWSYENEWFEETNISRKIKEYLVETGHEIIRFNEDKRKKGHDIEIVKVGIKTVIEVKGYPSIYYAKGEKQGLKKPTHPNLQAKHWFSEALLSLLLAKCQDWDTINIAMGLPRFQKYEELCSKISPFREKTGMNIYFVNESGKIDII